MLLSAVVDASASVAETAGRLAKRDAIAACIRGAGEDEVEIVVAMLSGETRQGRIGVGYATLSALRGGHAGEATLTVADVDAALARIAAIAGKGSAAARGAELAALFARATAGEQDFLVRLLVGELRQGALEGVMIEAIAAAAAVPVADVRRATMVTGSVGTAARVATSEGTAGLVRFAIALGRPVQPMLAQPADDVADRQRRQAGVAAAQRGERRVADADAALPGLAGEVRDDDLDLVVRGATDARSDRVALGDPARGLGDARGRVDDFRKQQRHARR